jgi:hypothetical protein
MKNISVVLTAFALVLGTSTALAQNGATNEWQEFCGTFYNPCCEELVDLCVDVKYRWDKDGVLSQINYQGQGTGEDGTKYVFVSNNQGHWNATSNGAYNATVTLSQKFIATGNSDCTFTAHYTLHVTVNANGETTSEVANVRFECENGEIF